MRKFIILKNVNSAQVCLRLVCQECAGLPAADMSGMRRLMPKIPPKFGVNNSF